MHAPQTLSPVIFAEWLEGTLETKDVAGSPYVFVAISRASFRVRLAA